MKLRFWRASMASTVAVLASVLATAVWAGGSGFGDDEEAEDEGPAYFGFVKDTNGATLPDAKVTVAVKNRGGVVTRTDALGAYKVPGFGKEVSPNDVEITCELQGYKLVRVYRRSLPPPNSNIPVETECTMQRNT